MLTIFGRAAGRRHRFHSLAACESLEPRRLMDGEDLVGSALIGAAESGVQAEASGFERFASADELKEYLLQAALAQYQHWFGRESRDIYFPGDVVALDSRSLAANASDTNVQVQGVDEADLVKTDGEYLYVLRGKDLLILDARPAQQMQLVSRTELSNDQASYHPTAMYLNGDRLTVLTQRYDDADLPAGGSTDSYLLYVKPRVHVKTYNVSDRTQPVLERQTVLDGTYVDSRQIGDRLVFVLQNYFALPAPRFIPDSTSLPDDDVSSNVVTNPTISWYSRPGRYETQEEYLARVGDQILELALPHYRSSAPGSTEQRGLLSEATDIYRPLTTTNESLISVVVLDANGAAAAPLDAVSVPTIWAGEVYASVQNIYVLGHNWSDNTTRIHKFHLSDESVELTAVGSVEGSLLNQFSIDEHEGFLRIATTSGSWFSTGNNVYVLGQEGNALKVVGAVEDLAPGERIFAVRFLGDRGFVVTFRQIDPLFAIDFSDPTQPRLAGELHIPGFSNYLHPVGENHLLGIGRNADMTGRQQELQVSLFDVSNLAEPRLVERFTIDAGVFAYSEATHDHHAVGYFSDTQTLAIPVSTYATSWGWTDSDGDGTADAWSPIDPPRSEMWVFHVDVSAGLSLQARIDLEGTVRRSVRIDDVLYSISTEMVSANSLADPNLQLASVDLSDEAPATSVSPNRVLRRAPPSVVTIAPPAFDGPILVTGAETGNPPEVRVLDAETLDERLTIEAYDPRFTGGVRVATGDINNDGTLDIVTAAGPGGGPHVRVFDSVTGEQLPGPLGSFYAYNPVWTGGVYVAVGDVNGDGRDDIVTGADSSGGPHVRVFNGVDGSELGGFYAFNSAFTGGARVAVGNFDSDDALEIVVSAGPGGGPHVRVFDGPTGDQLAGDRGSFYAYNANFAGGVFVSVGDINGDGRADLITGTAPGADRMCASSADWTAASWPITLP